jgi:hypothetical protein
MNINPATLAAIQALHAARRAARPALRVALRAAKRDLTDAANALADATRGHLRALRAETRARPVWLPISSDSCADLVARARNRYDSAAQRVDQLGAEYRRAL